MTYKQLTQDLRYQIYAMNQIEMLQKDIAAAINVSASIISRELKRNCEKRGLYVKNTHKWHLKDDKENQRVESQQKIGC